jgi:hypothetical protein
VEQSFIVPAAALADVPARAHVCPNQAAVRLAGRQPERAALHS